jgi:hypothetical protein
VVRDEVGLTPAGGVRGVLVGVGVGVELEVCMEQTVEEALETEGEAEPSTWTVPSTTPPLAMLHRSHATVVVSE